MNANEREENGLCEAQEWAKSISREGAMSRRAAKFFVFEARRNSGEEGQGAKGSQVLLRGPRMGIFTTNHTKHTKAERTSARPKKSSQYGFGGSRCQGKAATLGAPRTRVALAVGRPGNAKLRLGKGCWPSVLARRLLPFINPHSSFSNHQYWPSLDIPSNAIYNTGSEDRSPCSNKHSETLTMYSGRSPAALPSLIRQSRPRGCCS